MINLSFGRQAPYGPSDVGIRDATAVACRHPANCRSVFSSGYTSSAFKTTAKSAPLTSKLPRPQRILSVSLAQTFQEILRSLRIADEIHGCPVLPEHRPSRIVSVHSHVDVDPERAAINVVEPPG